LRDRPELTTTLTSRRAAEEISAQRGGKDHGPRHESKDRNKPIEQSLAEFADMKAGKYQPGQMVLRMKQDMESSNPTMWDIIAYRVLSKPHHRTGTEWCIYPTYDFTHCLCDSFENITYVVFFFGHACRSYSPQRID
jgi:glutaminyl-tRNA synthetase